VGKEAQLYTEKKEMVSGAEIMAAAMCKGKM